jgi:Icc-related predicted phosphoesterase
VRVAAVGDLHCGRTSRGALQAIFARASDDADLLLLAGDLTDRGHPDEARALVGELQALRVPAVAVLGNHDYEGGQEDEVRRILAAAGVMVLDGDACEVAGVGVAGVKGFAGGFGQHALGAWGERVVKQFVHEAVDEALKLESALARLGTDVVVVLLHYAPIAQTAAGEPPEVLPFVGSSRLEEPINRYPVSVVFHGHAHRGTLDGVTATGVPVHNVSLPLLAAAGAGQAPYRVVELPVPAPAAGSHNGSSGEPPKLRVRLDAAAGTRPVGVHHETEAEPR